MMNIQELIDKLSQQWIHNLNTLHSRISQSNSGGINEH